MAGCEARALSSTSVSRNSSEALLSASLFVGRTLRGDGGGGGGGARRVRLPRAKVPAIRAGETQSKGLGFEEGGKWMSSTTRHIRIYAGYIDPESGRMDQTQLDKLSLILDPDDEFVWPDDKSQKVFDKFAELVDNYAGAPLTEYTLRLIGSDLEHYIRKMLLSNEIKYNLECRVLNFSMGRPRLDMEEEEEEEEEAAV